MRLENAPDIRPHPSRGGSRGFFKLGCRSMSTGYSAKPLIVKLGIRDGMRALLIGVPNKLPAISGYRGFAAVDTGAPSRIDRVFDYIHVFETDRCRLEGQLGTVCRSLKPDGMIWMSWPKKASRVETDITESVLRDLLLPTGLVDIKVAAVDETWSGLKFVFRKEVRGSL